MENRADTLSFENKLCGIALKSEGMQVADGLLPRSGDSQEAAVEAVQKAAMTRQDMAAVLDAHLSLHLTFHQITPCAEHDHNQGKAQPHGQTVARRYPMPACHRGQQSEDAASDAAYPRLAGRHTGEQLPGEPAVKEASRQVSARISSENEKA